ncbi:hypothetical protein Leryth_024076 [Lithospermum erythrorhizon]|nr:hypothetical protein Leryth_024076 [Lithospermum erythrorhizon]
MVVPQKSSLPITKTGIIRLRQLFSTIKNNHDDAALQSSENRYKQSNAGEVPLVSHNRNVIQSDELCKDSYKYCLAACDISPSYLNRNFLGYSTIS